MSYAIEEYALDALTDDELRPIVDLVNLFGEEREPRHVAMTVEEYRVFGDAPGQKRRQWVVRHAAGQPIALTNTTYPDDGTNPDLLRTGISVAPDHRHEGIGTLLLSHVVEIAEDLGRHILSGVVFDTVDSGGAFARNLGATETMEFHMNSLHLPTLNLDLLREWSGDGTRRAPGYSLRLVEGDWPAELLEGMAHLYHVLERDMPTPQSWEPHEWTADRVEQMQAHYSQGMESLSTFAIRDEDEQLAGMSQLVRRHADPSTWLVTTTMVDPEHRGRALGKWLKAAVCLEAVERWPDGGWMETGNAFTNEAMLGINLAMGFQPEYTMTDVEVDLETVQAYLDRRRTRDVE